MTYKIGEKKDGKLIVEFEINADEWDAEVEKAYQKNKGKYKLDGFRQGKIPRKVLEKNFGEFIFYEDAIGEVCDKSFFEFLEKEKEVEAVAYPEISVKRIDKNGVEFVAVITVMPEVELGKMEDLGVKMEEVSVSDEEVDAKIKDLQEKQARYVDVKDRPARTGDLTNIDFVGSINGVAFEGGSAKDYELELGSHTFINGFEEQVAGMEIDQQKDINVTFPKEYGAKELAGKPAVFAVKLLAIREKQVPEIDDKFASDVSEFDTLEELKKGTKEKLLETKKANAKSDLDNKIVDAFVARCEVEVPEVMVKNQIERAIDDMKQSLKAQGLTYDIYLTYIGMTDEQFRESRKEDTKKSIKTTMVLSELIKREGIKVEESDIDAKVEEISAQMKKSAKEVKKTMKNSQREVVENNILTEKVIKLLKEKNNI